MATLRGDISFRYLKQFFLVKILVIINLIIIVICLTVDFFPLKLSKGSTLLIVIICEHCTVLTVFNGIYTIFTSNNSTVAVGKH